MKRRMLFLLSLFIFLQLAPVNPGIIGYDPTCPDPTGNTNCG